MKITKNSLVLTAAFAGLLTGTASRVSAATSGSDQGVNIGAASELGTLAAKKAIEKHACKGMNSCKGNGGGSKKEWGKNSCKGQGGCATDGSMKK